MTCRESTCFALTRAYEAMMIIRLRAHLIALGIVAATFAPTAASADDRDFCADRPGRGTPACTLAPGQAMIEVGVVGWDHDADAQSVNNAFNLADTLLRVGVTDTTELQIGLLAATNTRSRDRATGTVESATGVGDGYLAVRRGLAGDNGPAAVEVFLTLPLGKPPAGAGDWGAGVLVPFEVSLPADFELALTPEADAAVNASGNGRHLAYGGVAGLSHPLGKKASFSAEFAGFEDRDPAGAAFDGRMAGAVAYQLSKTLQLDFEADLGVTHAAPKRSFLIGFARRIG